MISVKANATYRLKNGRTCLVYSLPNLKGYSILEAAYLDFYKHRGSCKITSLEEILKI